MPIHVCGVNMHVLNGLPVSDEPHRGCRADTSVCPYMTSVYVYFPMRQRDVGADRRVRPVWDGRTTEKGGPKAALLTFVVNYS